MSVSLYHDASKFLVVLWLLLSLSLDSVLQCTDTRQIPGPEPLLGQDVDPAPRLARITYTRERLFNIKRSAGGLCRVSSGSATHIISALADASLLHFRGCKAGSKKQRSINVVNSSATWRPSQNQKNTVFIRKIDPSNLIQINTASPPIQSVASSTPYLSPACTNISKSQCELDTPRTYILNAASLAKPHAIESLITELAAYSIDLAIVVETHFKKHHSLNAYNIQGYQCLRRDRIGRKGGGVAFYVREGIEFVTFEPVNDEQNFKTLWIHMKWNNKVIIGAAVYHPPRPIYDVNKFINFLTNNVDLANINHPNSIILLAGDFNQLQNDISQITGLLPVVSAPTRGTALLDQLFISSSKKYCVKVVKSVVKSDHRAVIVSDNEEIVNTLKKKKTVTYRCRTPKQHSDFLSSASSLNWDSVLMAEEVQTCSDNFYQLSKCLLEKFYPTKTVTISELDPLFITLEVKSLLRKKNKFMRNNKVEKAAALADKIGKIIARYNSTRLAHIDPRSGCSAIWEEVRRLTGSSIRHSIPSSFTPELLNAHYCAISTDNSYTPPQPKLSVTQNSNSITEFEVFKLLDTLSPTATGPDDVPSWFLHTAAPIFSKPLTHLINLSLEHGTVPTQWKTAIIHPIPKLANPKTPSDLRPISVISILSRLTERLVIRKFLTPATHSLPSHLDMSNQFAYRPTSSTTAALIAMLSCVTELLQTNSHVHCITFDYSKAFDTLAHSSVASKLSELPISDHIYNWIINYLSNRTHTTRLRDSFSSSLPITAGIVQGSLLGPTLFNINSSELKPISPLNHYFKYADDSYLIVPAFNSSSIPAELQHHAAWAASCNFKLNMSKTSEIIFRNKRSMEPEESPGVERVTSMKVLGVTVDSKLTFSEHIDLTVTSCTQSLFAFRTMRQHGLSDLGLNIAFRSTIISKLLYAAPSYWGFLSSHNRDRIQAFLQRAIKFGYYSPSDPEFSTLITTTKQKLFMSILLNPVHVLHPLLPA